MIKYWNIYKKFQLNLELNCYNWRKWLMHANYHAIFTRKIQTKNSQLGRHIMVRWQKEQPILARKVCSLRFVARLITRKIYPRIPRSPIYLFPGLFARLSLSSLSSPETRSWMSTAADNKWFAADKKLLWTKKTLERNLWYMVSTLIDHTPQPPLVR